MWKILPTVSCLALAGGRSSAALAATCACAAPADVKTTDGLQLLTPKS